MFNINFDNVRTVFEEHPIVVSALKGAVIGLAYFGIDAAKSKLGISGDFFNIDFGKDIPFGQSKGYYDYKCDQARYEHEERMAKIARGM